MGHRTVRWADTEWQVWDVRPTENGLVSDQFATRAGMPREWLCMESATEKRRIAPIPEHWEAWPDSELAARIAGAPVVERSGQVSAQRSDDLPAVEPPPT